jgi:N-acetylglucosamine kinase-like BadF-type ATPase
MGGQSLLIFGADGGGTKTLGVLADDTGAVLARCEAGPSNPATLGVERSAAAVFDLLSRCCSEAGRTPDGIGAAVIGLAGVGTRSIRDELSAAIGNRFAPGGRAPVIVLEPDSRIALEGAFEGGHGAIVIAGTGSNVLGKDRAGRLHGAGGWGRILGDEGSGHDIGVRALKSVILEIDGRSGATSIGQMLRERFGFDTRDRIIAAVYREGFPMASVAPVILELADAGDPAAVTLLREAAGGLADQARSVLQCLGPDPRAALVGGIVSRATAYREILGRALLDRVPDLSIVPAMHAPVDGAVMMARFRVRS